MTTFFCRYKTKNYLLILIAPHWEGKSDQQASVYVSYSVSRYVELGLRIGCSTLALKSECKWKAVYKQCQPLSESRCGKCSQDSTLTFWLLSLLLWQSHWSGHRKLLLHASRTQRDTRLPNGSLVQPHRHFSVSVCVYFCQRGESR